MTATLLISAALASLMPPVLLPEEKTTATQVEAAYAALAEGRTEDALNKLKANRARQSGEPAQLINLGTAYARIGNTAKARTLFEAALISKTRYDLELADGSWMDSRDAARMALANLGTAGTLASR